TFVVERRGTAQGGADTLGQQGARAGRKAGREQHHCDFLDHDRHTRSMRTAHFLKSVCSEIGSVASSVTLLISLDSSNHGTNTSPRGGLSRPRVSTRARM